MLLNSSEQLYQSTTERIAQFQAEACHNAQVREAKEANNSEPHSSWTPRQRFGYMLMRWGYRLAKENKAA
jgi:hypothetical protein